MLKSNSNAAVEFNGEYFIELSPGKFRKAIREPGASSGSYYNWVSCECGGIRKGTAKQCSLCIRKKWDEKNAAATTCKCGKPKNIKSDLCAECFRKSVAVDVSVKTYIECRLDLPSDDFYVKKKSADGSIQNLSSRCRKCSDERKRIQLGSQLHPDSGIAANHHSPANHGGRIWSQP